MQLRPAWDDYFMGVAVAVAARGDCFRCQVGAVLVEDATHRIIATGYNGSVPGGPSCLARECPRCNDLSIPGGQQYENCIEIHAEDNCMRYAEKWFGNRLWSDHTLYVTRQPCNQCLPVLLWDLELGSIVYREHVVTGFGLSRWELKRI